VVDSGIDFKYIVNEVNLIHYIHIKNSPKKTICQEFFYIMNKKQRSDIGKRLRQTRQDLGKTQIDMAKILRIQQSAISKLERGDVMPTVEILLKLSSISGRSIDWILRGS